MRWPGPLIKHILADAVHRNEMGIEMRVLNRKFKFYE